jgi:D-serine deaminase-like pyridoxal phosphate-dependent protein
MDLLALQTPALLLERTRLERNLAAMRERARSLGVALRPHLKTAKSAHIARLATAGGPAAITVSTVREAEYFAAHGVSDIVYAVGITPDKIGRAAALAARGVTLRMITDCVEGAAALAAFEPAEAGPLRVLLEIDTGAGRAGVLPDSDALLAVAARLTEGTGAVLDGVLTHAGHSYGCRSLEEMSRVAEEERSGAVRAAERLRAAGHACPMVSVGSTPTAVAARDLDGVTEMRPGVYMFFDLDQATIGSCGRDDIALSVLASVIGHNRHAGHILLDAGALALSKDVSAAEIRPEIGYGDVCDALSLEPLLGFHVHSVHQEHGMVPVAGDADYERLPVGAKVRILPNHACITAAAHAHYDVVDGAEVVERWDRVNGW